MNANFMKINRIESLLTSDIDRFLKHASEMLVEITRMMDAMNVGK